MSLLGRLEDLSLGDIIQIVYLSRRTGVLEVNDDRGRHSLIFRNGLLVDATSSNTPHLTAWLAARAIDPQQTSTDVVAEAVRARMLEVITPLLGSGEGEFNFILADDARPFRLDYDPDALFREGGLTPPRILGSKEGERPLRALEESLRAGKALTRATEPAENLVPFPSATIADETLPLNSRREGVNQFRVAGGLIAVESPEGRMRNVILYERDPLIRVAAKRAFARREITIAQFGSLEDVRRAMSEWFRSNAFFVSVLELADGSNLLLREIKRKNSRLPVAVVDQHSDATRRHDLALMGADLYLTKPAGTSEQELDLFAEELIVFAERAFDQWEQLSSHWGAEAGKRFYQEAEREQTGRSFDVLKQFIAELSNPNDIGELAATILRLASEYLDRAALFVVHDDVFAGLGDARAVRISRGTPSILSDVAASGEAHRGKMRRTPANEQLIDGLGGALPTEVVALPIVHSGRTIGILYGDNAEHRAPIDTLTGLEIFLSQAGYAFENAVVAAEQTGAP